MKPLLLTILLFLTLSCIAQDSTSYSILAWKQEHNITYLQIQIEGVWLVFALPGDHLNDVTAMINTGCILTKRYALYNFDPIRGLRYVGKGDEGKLKQILGIDKICNK